MIGIIGAMEVEVDILKENLDIYDSAIICGIEFFEGRIESNDVVLTKCGVGKVNAAMAATILISHYNCDLIINTGIAGGINGVNTKDIVIGNKLMYHDVDCSIFGYELGQVPGMPVYLSPEYKSLILIKKALHELGFAYKEGTIYTGDVFVSEKDSLERVNLDCVCIAEMEGAAIAHVCVKANVDFMVIRYISDVVGAENQIEDYMAFEGEMAHRSAEICLEIFQKL